MIKRRRILIYISILVLHLMASNSLLSNIQHVSAISHTTSSDVVSILGENSEDWSGIAFTGVGDTNNDGFDDFLVSATLSDHGGLQSGEVYLLLGRTQDYWKTNNTLGDMSNASYLGEAQSDTVGEAITGVGDVNNDGFDDFLIGGPRNQENGLDAGQTYLIFGRSDFTGFRNYSLANADASFLGENQFDQSGKSVAGVGDVNNDGFDDFIIGAPYNSEGGRESGQTYLILGRPSTDWSMDMSLSLANASFLGESENTGSGWAVSGIDDINNDDFDDFMISAPYQGTSGNLPGKVFLILGRPSSDWSMDMRLSQADGSISGETDSDQAGYSISNLGDVNNDGKNDVLIGANWNDRGGEQSGSSYLILNASRIVGNSLSLSTDSNVIYTGENAMDLSGMKVSSVGDKNSDGYNDFLIAAPSNSEGGIYAGKVYLIFGQSQFSSNPVISLSTINNTYIGDHPEDGLGQAMAGVGDSNGDGSDDFILGAFGSDDNGDDSGHSYLVQTVIPPNCVKSGQYIFCSVTETHYVAQDTTTITETSRTYFNLISVISAVGVFIVVKLKKQSI